MKKVKVLGLEIIAEELPVVINYLVETGRSQERVIAVEAADVHVVTRARRQNNFLEVMKSFDLICPDGMPVFWLMNRKLKPDQKTQFRICGADLMESMIEKSEQEQSCSHFFLGGSNQLLSDLKSSLLKKYPRAQIKGSYSPPFGEWPPTELEKISELINKSEAQHVWVGLGCPKQESWIGSNKEELPPACYYGVGAAFAFHAGWVKRAPDIFQKTGLEWFYRLCKEPRRLYKRYFVYNLLFISYLIKDNLFLRSRRFKF